MFLDTTCLKANIHFPVDWVLMRDGVKSLMQSVELIRSHGGITFTKWRNGWRGNLGRRKCFTSKDAGEIENSCRNRTCR
jgi:hypothetical protein